jgi:hypothetical protein
MNRFLLPAMNYPYGSMRGVLGLESDWQLNNQRRSLEECRAVISSNCRLSTGKPENRSAKAGWLFVMDFVPA